MTYWRQESANKTWSSSVIAVCSTRSVKFLVSERQLFFSIITWRCDYISLYDTGKSATADLPSKEWGKWKVLLDCLFVFCCFVVFCLFVGWLFFFCNEDFKISFDIHATYCYTLPQGIVYYIWRTANKYAKAFGFRKRGPLVKNCRELP